MLLDLSLTVPGRTQLRVACHKLCDFRNVRPVKTKETTRRSIFRWLHLIFAIPVIGCIYSPFKELPNYALVVRYVAFPVIALSGLWMWKGPALRRLVSKIGKK